MQRMRLALPMFLICLGLSAAAWAEGEAPAAEGGTAAEGMEDRTPAMQAFAAGKQLYNDGRFADAAAKFREADALKPSWKLWFNIGQSEAAARRNGLALEAFERYVTLGGDEIPVARREAVLEEIARLQPVVGYVDVVAPEGSRVRIDGIERGTVPLPGPLMTAAAVEHEILVEHGSKPLLSRKIMVGGGRTVKLEATAAAPSQETDEPVAPVSPVSAPPASGLQVAGWVVFGAGLATLAAGGGTGIAALMKSNDLKSRCPDGLCSSSADLALEDSVIRLSVATDVLLAVGGTVAVTGLVLALVGRKKSSTPDEVGLKAHPFVGQSRGGLLIEGSF
jgi:hypothetical protein